MLKMTAVSNRDQGKPTYFMYLPWPLQEAVLSISTFCFLFKCARKLLFLIYMLCMIRRSPTEITPHQVLVSTIFNVL